MLLSDIQGTRMCCPLVDKLHYGAALYGTQAESILIKSQKVEGIQIWPNAGRAIIKLVCEGGMVCVVDPVVVKALRKATYIKRVIYVSCNPGGVQVLQNIVE